MTKVITFSIIFIIPIIFSSFNRVETGTIEVNIEGLRNKDGQIMISLSHGPTGFPKDNYYRQYFIKEYNAPKHTMTFENVPFGNYAVSLLHDEDKNGEMTKNFFGMPEEGFAFSRNYKVSLRAPKYKEVNFDLSNNLKTLTINLQY